MIMAADEKRYAPDDINHTATEIANADAQKC